jgi:hypothetical protein
MSTLPYVKYKMIKVSDDVEEDDGKVENEFAKQI